MNSSSQFNVATAALEYLELLNCSNQNPLEIAAQFRTLLRSRKSKKTSNIDYTYMDYIVADATIRKQGRSHSLRDHRSRPLRKIQHDTDKDQFVSESHSSNSLSEKNQNVNNLIENTYPDSAIDSDSSDRIIHQTNSNILSDSMDLNSQVNLNELSKSTINSSRYQCPLINWKQLREKQYEYKLDKIKKISSTVRLSRIETNDISRNKIESSTLSNQSDLQKKFQNRISNETTSPRSRSSSNSIRTPSMSPINSPRSTYTISRLNSTLIDQNKDDILFPIADCNLVIKHRPIERTKTISSFEHLYNDNKHFRCNTGETIYV